MRSFLQSKFTTINKVSIIHSSSFFWHLVSLTVSDLEMMPQYSRSGSLKSSSSFSKRKHPSTIREELEPCIKHCRIYCGECSENNPNPFKNSLKRQISANDFDRCSEGNREPGKFRKTLSETSRHTIDAKFPQQMDNEVLFQIMEFLLEEDPQVKATTAWDMLPRESKDEYIRDFLKRQIGKVVANGDPNGNDNFSHPPQRVKFGSSRENESLRQLVEKLCTRVEEFRLAQEKSRSESTDAPIARSEDRFSRFLRENRFWTPSMANLLNPEEPMTDSNSGLEQLRLWREYKSINLKVEELTDLVQRLNACLPPTKTVGDKDCSTEALPRLKSHTAVQQKLDPHHRSVYLQVEDSSRKDGARSNHNLIGYITSKSRQLIRRLRRKRRTRPPLGLYRSPHPNIAPNRPINSL